MNSLVLNGVVSAPSSVGLLTRVCVPVIGSLGILLLVTLGVQCGHRYVQVLPSHSHLVLVSSSLFIHVTVPSTSALL